MARELALDLRGFRDALALRVRHPDLCPTRAERERIALELRPAYEDYVENVSEPSWAVSLETAVVLCHLCRTGHPTKLLDTGSGFSSYVFRRHAAESIRAVKVVSVDTDRAWLEKTSDFLRRHDLDVSHMVTWPSDLVVAGTYDVVFHDLALGTIREESMSIVSGAVVRPSGVLVFDDAHVHGGQARAVGERLGLELYDLRRWTLDAFGRFSLLGVAT